MNQLFVDGGVIKVNPSPFGGTFAIRLLEIDKVVKEHSGVITPKELEVKEVTNNHTEMLAFVIGLGFLPDEWSGMIYSDSQITLGRAFLGFKWNNIPGWLRHDYKTQRDRLINWEKIMYTRLDGHPTKAHLEAGKGKRGGPVSIHNVWCDEMCGKAGREFMGNYDDRYK